MSAPIPGSAYIFVRPPGGWAGRLTESARLAASDGAARDSFGRSLAVSADTVVVGASTGRRPPVYVFVEPTRPRRNRMPRFRIGARVERVYR